MFDHFETEITCEEVYPDEFLDLAFAVGASHLPDPDDDILDDDDDDGAIICGSLHRRGTGTHQRDGRVGRRPTDNL